MEETQVMILGLETVGGTIPILEQLIDGKKVISVIINSEPQANCTCNRAINQSFATDPIDILESLHQVANKNSLTITIDESMIC